MDIVGTNGNDTLFGTASADNISGNGGNDNLSGADGNDTVVGGSGNDTVRGNNGTDWIEGGTGNDDLGGGSGQDSFALRAMGTANADLLFDFATGWDNVQLDAATFTDIGAAGRFTTNDARFRTGTAAQDADDRIIFNSTTGQLFYDADGNGAGAQQLIATLPSGRTVTASDFWVFGTPPSGGDVIRGTNGNDSLTGTAGNDSMEGLAGNDTLNGGAGADTMDGGLHDDVFIVDNVGDVVIEVEGGGSNDEIQTSVTYTLPAFVNNLTLTGTANLNGFGNELANIITGNAGNNFLDGGQGSDLIIGGAGNDRLDTGVSLDDRDTLDGGLGDDVYLIRRSSVDPQLIDAGGTEWVITETESWTLAPGFENLQLDFVRSSDGGTRGIGNELDNIIIAPVQSFTFNNIDGGAGDDTLTGGSGVDSFNFDLSAADFGNDVVDGGAGPDSVNFSNAVGSMSIDLRAGTVISAAGTVALSNIENASGGAFDDLIIGTDTGEPERFYRLWGGGGDDTIVGASDVDLLNGGDGDDRLDGKEGVDELSGGAGADQYLFTAAPGLANADWVVVFESGIDKIVLDGGAYSAIGASGNFAAGDPRFRLGTSAQDADDRVIYDASTGELWYDADGNGAGVAQLVARLDPVRPVTASDIAVENGGTGGGGAINGTAGNDTLVGTPGNDTINGLGGNDSISGLGGDDSISGGDGNDTIDPGEGNDTVSGGAGIDTLVTTNGALPADIENLTLRGSLVFEPSASGNDLNNIIRNEYTSAPTLFVNGQGGNDTIVGGSTDMWVTFSGPGGAWGNDVVQGGSGTDTLDLFDKTAMTIDMGAGTLTGGGTGSITFSGVDEILAGAFDDVLNADDSGVRFAGDLGNDTLRGGSGDDFLHGDEGLRDHLPAAEGGNDWIFAGGGNDTIVGWRGADTLDGGGGDDEFLLGAGEGEYGNDTILGGDGIDTVRVTGGDLVVSLAAGTLTGGHAGGSASLSSIENFEAGGGNDRITGSVVANRLQGGEGNDTIDGGAGNDTLLGGNDFNGSAGDDTFLFTVAPGTTNADVVLAFGSTEDNIVLDGNAHANSGASGNFVAGDVRFRAGTSAQDADDRVIFDAATGRLWYDADGSGAGAQQLIATVQGSVTATDIAIVNGSGGTGGGGTITGTPGNDSLTGTNGNDTIDGGAGNDTMNGLLGNDTYYVNPGDVIQDSGGIDLIFALSSFALPSPIENITYLGSANTSSVGNSLNNAMTGNSGRNYMEGRGGNDTLAGGTGIDTLNGGVGNDLFVFGEMGAANADAINGFIGAEDNLAFDDAVFAGLGSAGSFRSGAGLSTGQDADDRLIYNSSTGQLYYDADGSGAGGSQLVATLGGAPGLTASDITVI